MDHVIILFVVLLTIICDLVFSSTLPPHKACGGVKIPPVHFDPTHFLQELPPKVRIPFRVNYFMHPATSAANRESLQRAFVDVNSKFSSLVKAAPIPDARFDRSDVIDPTGNCPPVRCGDTRIPDEFAVPCSLQSHKGKPIPGYTLSALVLVHGDGVKKDQECNHRADAMPCRFEQTLQPTHGRIFLCVQPKDDRHELLVETLIHETLHLMTGDNVGSLFRLNPNVTGKVLSYETLLKEAYNFSWTARKSEYSPPGKVQYRFYTITPSVQRAARNHFGCDDVIGAELATKHNGKHPDFGHWNPRLFIDEIMIPFTMSLMRVSNIVLALLNDSGWYDVDFAKAEPLSISRPVRNGCDIARKSCHKVQEENRKKGEVDFMPPYCDHSQMRCTENGTMLLDCTAFGFHSDYCSIFHSPFLGRGYNYYGAMCQRQMQPQPNASGTDNCTTCVSVNFPPYGDESATSYCFKYQCYEMNSTIVFAYEDELQCQFRCHKDDAYKTKYYRFSGGCELIKGKTRFICPDYDSICRCTTNESLGPEYSGVRKVHTDSHNLALLVTIYLFLEM